MAELGAALGGGLATEQVIQVAAEVQTKSSPLEGAIALLRAEDDIEASELDGVLVIHDELPTVPERELLRVAGLIDGPGTTVVRGKRRDGKEVNCIWRAPFLLFTRQTSAGLGGRLCRVEGSNPRTLATGWDVALGVRDNLPESVSWLPGMSVPEDAGELLRVAGLSFGADS